MSLWGAPCVSVEFEMVLFGGVTQSTVLCLKGGLLGDKDFPIWVL